MADHGHHDPGGHELEAINTKMLFRLMISLSLVTLLASAAVVQWFYSQRRELEGRYAAEGSFQLMDYKAKMGADLEGVDAVAQELVTNPAMLQAPPPPPGWTHPDDLVGTAAPAAAEAKDDAAEPEPEPEPEQAEPEQDEPVEVDPEQDAPQPEPLQDEPAQDEPAQDKPAKPAQDKPAQPKPAPKQPEPASDSDNG